jgi:hypothetical protein
LRWFKPTIDRPLEWNSCNEREHYGARVALFNDMDEFVISELPLLELTQEFPSHCRGVHVGQYWTKVECPSQAKDPLQRAFVDLDQFRHCRIFMDSKELVMDVKKRVKMVLKTERDDIHNVLNHDLAVPLEADCKAIGLGNQPKYAFQLHMINMRPGGKLHFGWIHSIYLLLNTADSSAYFNPHVLS